MSIRFKAYTVALFISLAMWTGIIRVAGHVFAPGTDGVDCTETSAIH